MSEELHWHIHIVCKDCGHERRIVNPDPSVDVLEGSENGKKKRMRGVLVFIPNECPECKNLKLVVT